MKDSPLAECPECGEKKLKRLVGGGAGLIFKGTGFYITDYRKPGGGEGKAGETKTSADTKGAGESKSTTDSKGASAKAPAPASTAAAKS